MKGYTNGDIVTFKEIIFKSEIPGELTKDEALEILKAEARKSMQNITDQKEMGVKECSIKYSLESLGGHVIASIWSDEV